MKKSLVGGMLALSLVLTACGGKNTESKAKTAEPKVLEGVTTKGMGGEAKPLKVKVTVEGEKITKVEVVEHGETPNISDPAIEKIPGEIVKAGKTDGVEAVSGATITSNAIKDAVNNALASNK